MNTLPCLHIPSVSILMLTIIMTVAPFTSVNAEDPLSPTIRQTPALQSTGSGSAAFERARKAVRNPYNRRLDCAAVGGTLVGTGALCVIYGIAQFVMPTVHDYSFDRSSLNGTRVGVMGAMSILTVGAGAFQLWHGGTALKVSVKEWKMADEWDRSHNVAVSALMQGSIDIASAGK